MKSKEKEKIHTSSWLCLHWKPWKNWESSKEQEQEPHPYSGESKSSALLPSSDWRQLLNGLRGYEFDLVEFEATKVRKMVVILEAFLTLL